MNAETKTLIVDHEVYTTVSYDERMEAKKIERRLWFKRDGVNSWIAPAGVDLVPLRKWLPEPYASQVAELLGEEREKGITLFALMNQVKNVIQQNLNTPQWVRAEILKVQHKGNYLRLELSDYGDVKEHSSKTQGSIFGQSMAAVDRFKQATGVELKSGMKILFKAQPSFHEQYGMSLNIMDIDSNFTIGDMAAKVNKIRGQMRLEGILESNKKLPTPKHFTRVAVIAPSQAAGLDDFRTKADALAHYGVCEFDYYHATFQGNQMMPTMEKCFQDILKRQEEYDCIVMIRGGGDKQGLYELNEETLTRMVCRSPLPVIVGIGHEPDITILDEVANVRCPTPSLAIGHIFSVIMHNAREAKANFLRIQNNVKQRIEFERTQLSRTIMQINMNITSQITAQREAVKDFTIHIRQNVLMLVADQRSHVKSLMQTALLQDPRKILSKGYAVARDADNNVITTAEQAENLPAITIQFQDGNTNFVKDV